MDNETVRVCVCGLLAAENETGVKRCKWEITDHAATLEMGLCRWPTVRVQVTAIKQGKAHSTRSWAVVEGPRDTESEPQ